MSHADDSDDKDRDEAAPERPRYEPPRIVWREPYEPLSFGASCAKQQGNPPCNPGPFKA